MGNLLSGLTRFSFATAATIRLRGAVKCEALLDKVQQMPGIISAVGV